MKINLKRIRHKELIIGKQIETIIEGNIYIDGKYICDTLENMHNGLPEGKYNILLEKCNFRDRKMPLIIAEPQSHGNQCEECFKPELVFINTSPKSILSTMPTSPDASTPSNSQPIFCPQISPGNGIIHRHDGSILIGKRATTGLLIHPKSTFDTLYERIRKSLHRGHEVTILIS